MGPSFGDPAIPASPELRLILDTRCEWRHNRLVPVATRVSAV